MKKQILIILLAIISVNCSYGQIKKDHNYESKFIEINGVRTHYLDFGGEGLAVILIHSEAWDAYTYKDFAPLLTLNNRVLAITRPGYGKSDIGSYKVEDQGDYLIAFANALKIDQAVFIGNSSVTSELTYLAENYPQRLAGIVYLSGLAGSWGLNNLDPYKTDEMFSRASPATNKKNDREVITRAREAYMPKHFKHDSIKIEVPALAFVAQNGRQGHEEGIAALVFIGSPLMDDIRKTFPKSPLRTHLDRMANDPVYRNKHLNDIQDSIAREYFINLAADSVLQKKVYQFHMEKIYPSVIKVQDRMLNAFGDHMHVVKLEVPQIVGYEYRDTPDLIIDHVKKFLQELD